MQEGGDQLVGRERELGRLEQPLDEPGVDAPVFQVVGEPGIGKSRLLGALAARAHEERHLVFAGRAAEFEGEVPFGVFVDALDPYLSTVNTGLLRGLGEEQRGELAAVFPALAEIAEPSPAALQSERYRSHHAVRAMLELLARRRPCLLLLDDMHWADQASLELVAHLLRRSPGPRVLIALAFRPPQAPQRLVAPLERAEREGRCERLELAPLNRAEAELVLDASLDPSTRDELYTESGGNPFYLEQLGRAARRGGFASGVEPSRNEGVPRTVIESIADEVADLSSGSRLMLQGAAVAGDPFTAELAAAAADVPERRALEALDELMSQDLVRTTPSPMDFRFRHPIVRSAVYEAAGEGWRLGAHARAATALRDRGATAPAVAHHVEQSAHAGDEEAIALLTEAGHATAARAPAAAATWFGAALRLLPGDGGDRRLELLIPMASALGSSGQLEEGRETLSEVIALLPEEAGPVRARVLGLMAVIDHLTGRHGDARELLADALHGLPDQSSPEAASLHFELASDRYFVGDWSGMHEWAERGWRLSEQIGDPGLRATGTSQLALAEYSLGRMADARVRMLEARALLDGPSDGEDAMRLDAFDWIGWCELSMEDYEHALRHFEQGVEIGRRTGQGHLLATMSFGLVLGLGMTGRLGEAATWSDATLELARVSGSDQLNSWALGLRSWICLRTGQVDEAVALGEEARRLGDAVVGNPFSAVNGAWLGEAQIEAGQPGRGRTQVVEALGGPELAGVEQAFRPYFYEVLTRAELALGDADAAGKWAERAEESVATMPLSGRAALALRAKAAVALATGEARSAADLADQAVDAAAALPIDAARAQILAGRALAAVGERERAVGELERARAELAACGAGRYRDQAIRELRRLGERVGQGGRRGRGESGVEALSAREREVAELVTERLTNREIAERLVLSEKTIERHLSRIFQKLAVSSRVDVAREIEAETRPAASL